MAGVCPADIPRSYRRKCAFPLLLRALRNAERDRRGVRENERGGRRPRGKSINWRSERTRASAYKVRRRCMANASMRRVVLRTKLALRPRARR